MKGKLNNTTAMSRKECLKEQLPLRFKTAQKKLDRKGASQKEKTKGHGKSVQAHSRTPFTKNQMKEIEGYMFHTKKISKPPPKVIHKKTSYPFPQARELFFRH